jgi:hypothetical protein
MRTDKPKGLLIPNTSFSLKGICKRKTKLLPQFFQDGRNLNPYFIGKSQRIF